jgi:PAS domain S-box-containing protein
VENTIEDKRKKYKILIVDDSKTNLDYLQSILQQPDYLITTANNGTTAITKAKGNSFDIILLDVVMEGIDGFEVCKELKHFTATKDVPIIFLTSLTDPQNITKGFELGAVDYVKKPFNHSELKARVQTHLELKRSKDTIGEKNKQLAETNKELEKLSLVASSTSNSVIITNAKGEIEWVNDGFTRLSGYTFEELRKLKGANLSDWSGNRDIAEVIDECLKKKQSIGYSSVNVTKAGKGRWVQTTLTPVVNNNGDVVKMVAIDSDITEIKQAEQEIKKKNLELAVEKKRSDELLLNVLPYETAEELKKFGKARPKQYELTSVLFTDFVGFSKIAETISPEQLITELDNYFIRFDEIIARYKLEKIKTIGDSYMCAGGIPVANRRNPFEVVLAGLDIQMLMAKINTEQIAENKTVWKLRLGIHSGDLITGVVGEMKFAYDIWGDTVNTASRIESSGEAGKVNISGSTYEIIKDYFDCSYRGKIQAKNKGEIDMYFVERIKPIYAAVEGGTEPNELFYSHLQEIESMSLFDKTKSI